MMKHQAFYYIYIIKSIYNVILKLKRQYICGHLVILRALSSPNLTPSPSICANKLRTLQHRILILNLNIYNNNFAQYYIYIYIYTRQ